MVVDSYFDRSDRRLTVLVQLFQRYMEMRKSEPFFFSGLPLFSAAVFILIFQGAFFSPQVLGQDTPITALAHPLRVQPESVNLQGSSVLSDRFDVSYYHLTLNLNGLRNPILIGRNRIEGTAIADLDSLQFDLSTNMVVDFVSLTSGNVLKTIHQNDKLTVVLGTKLTAGKRLEMDVVYHGNPEETGFGAFSNIQNVSGKPNTIWTLSEPYGSKEWWPSDDQLTDKADSVRITVHIPAPMTVGSNGVLLSRKLNMDGSSTFDWMHRYPISQYLVSLAIGEYDEYVQSYGVFAISVRPGHLSDSSLCICWGQRLSRNQPKQWAASGCGNDVCI